MWTVMSDEGEICFTNYIKACQCAAFLTRHKVGNVRLVNAAPVWGEDIEDDVTEEVLVCTPMGVDDDPTQIIAA